MDDCRRLYCYFHNVSANMSYNAYNRNGYRRWFAKLLRRQSSSGCWFNPDYRRVTIQEYLTLLPVYGIRTSDPRGFNKGRSSNFRVGCRVRQTPEEGRRTYRPKCCGNDNKDEDNSPKSLNDKNHQASSKTFRQSSYLVLSNSINSNNSVKYKYSFCLHTVNCPNSFISYNSL